MLAGSTSSAHSLAIQRRHVVVVVAVDFVVGYCDCTLARAGRSCERVLAAAAAGYVWQLKLDQGGCAVEARQSPGPFCIQGYMM